MWDQILGFAVLGGIIAGVWWGKRAAKRKAERIRAEAKAEAKAELSAMLVQNVTVNGDDRRRVDFGAAVERAADRATDDATYDRAGHVRRRLHDGDRSGELHGGGDRAAVRAGGRDDGDAHVVSPAVLNHALAHPERYDEADDLFAPFGPDDAQAWWGGE